MKTPQPTKWSYLSIAIFVFSFSSAFGQSIAKPVYTYLNDFSFSDTSGIKLKGPARVINVDGRKGLNLTSIRSVLELKAHNLKSEKGTITIWVMSLEELSAYDPKPAFSMDNPHFFIYPLSFGAKSTPVEKNVWHKLQFLQIGNKLIGAIDGIIMVEFNDDGFTNNGPVYDFGRIAIRCMLRSKLLFRNIRVFNQDKFITERYLNTDKK